ncbi:MAG: quinone-dependent dihydroorotate dehydrogenase [Rhodospirillales bacterium]|nr:quinone-dependent dihydroorotate dehydrogenase [Rhodospirillales bacterium]
MPDFFRWVGPLLHRLHPETAHNLTLLALELGLAGQRDRSDNDTLGTECFGLRFPNPVGLAAGFDKDARVPGAMLGLGFGFVEVGTVTPKPQPGNPKPRVFRLAEDRAVINRMGFNNGGAEAMAARLARRRPDGLLGINIGKNRTSDDSIADYRTAFAGLAGFADYVVVNVSSPNTPGLRDLQAVSSLRPLLEALVRDRAAGETGEASRTPPLILKLAPDLAVDDAVAAAELAVETGFDGVAIANTTVSRPGGLSSQHKQEGGGLSGRPLFDMSTDLLRRVYRASGGKLPLIGIGGIDSADTAYAKICAGASLIQLYTGMAYGGPALVAEILDGLVHRLNRDGLSTIGEAVGRDA